MIGMFGKVPLTTRIVIYVGLGIAALVMLYPFLFMVGVSLKYPSEVAGNLDLMPMAPVFTTVNNKQEPLYEYAKDGKTTRIIRVGSAPSVGVFVDPAKPADRVLRPMNQAQLNDTKGKGSVKGVDYDYFTVTLEDGSQRDLVRIDLLKQGRYAPPDNSSAEVVLPDTQVTAVKELRVNWSNYENVLQLQNMSRAFLNTVLVTILVTLGQIATSAIAGYAFARMQFPGRNSLFVIYLGTIMVPFIVIIIPLYQLMNAMGWINKIVSLIVPWFFTAYGTFFMRQFFLTIPKEIEEAAIVDGCSRMGILVRIFVPLSLAPLGTLATFTFLYAWNSFLWPLISISAGNPDDQVITLVLNTLRGQSQFPNIVMAGATLSIVPAMIVFVFAQRYFIEGISTTGLAGR